MAICDNADKLISITHTGAGTMAQAVGGSITETVTWSENRPANAVAPECVKMDTYDCTARARFQGLVTPSTKGTSSTLTFNIEEFDAGAGSVAVATMLNGAVSFDFDSRPFTQMVDFKYIGTSTNPITVSL